ncbi:DUF4870 domain-containing protein [Cellulomonas pakistanensis]|uniref:DUF4870 domain-containing protein n=1 Tax=Cellulomonas pakistanensis TaxID=992287 RepID=A0A919U259_9CELL|nr:DUF4870 domain-containing protein [Cellulomonas pakistanensis]GIG35693.1 hypothetical protein Cpa01nite_10740 [Cellulomonas pakistanensis]
MSYDQQPPAGGPQQPPFGGQPQQPYGGQPQQPYGGQPQQPLRPDEEKTWSLLAHLGGILFSFVAPLVVWLVFKGRGPFLDDQAKEALNFQITVAIAYVASWILAGITFGWLSFLPFVVGVAALVFAILAAVAVNKGQWYRYPVTLRLVK